MSVSQRELIPEVADPHIQDLTGLPLQDQLAFACMFHDAANTPTSAEQIHQRMELSSFAGELILGDRIQRQADLDLRNARKYNEQVRRTIQERGPQHSVLLKSEDIGWLKGQEDSTVPLQLEGTDAPFMLGSIIDKNRTTQAVYDHLADQGIAEDLQATLTHDVLPRFLQDLQSGSGRLRPINYGRAHKQTDQRFLPTELPSYKLELQGTNNRAIIMLPEKVDNLQTILVVAIYDHKHQDKIINGIGRR